MNVAYLDCSSGISGDMFLAALIDAGLNEKELLKNLQKLHINRFSLSSEKTNVNKIAARKLIINAPAQAVKSRSLSDIKKIIQKSKLSGFVKTKSRQIFDELARAEGKIHGMDLDKVHFHEIGSIDSIIDIVGACLAIELLEIEQIYSTNVTLGRGWIKCAHGILPAPAPAALELLKTRTINLSDISHELVTPTGAAILKVLTKETNTLPQFKIQSIGYGAGSFKLQGFSNVLRVLIGEKADLGFDDEVMVIEANIDDTLPLNFEYVFEQLFRRNALDVYITNIMMKKNRPAVKLSVLAREQDLPVITKEIFKQTSTFGLRTYKAYRYKLEQKIIPIKTKYGKLRVKVGKGHDGVVTISPEYEDCKKQALKLNVPFRLVYEEAKLRALKNHQALRSFASCLPAGAQDETI